MTRRCLMALTFCLLGTIVAAQNPPVGDPDAKGTTTVSVGAVNNGSVSVTVTRAATAPWTVDTVFVFAMPEGGGKFISTAVPYFQADDMPPQASLTFSPFQLPNGTYTIWSIHNVGSPPGQNNGQAVGSALASVTVTNSPVPAWENGGSITISAARTNGNAAFTASGAFNFNEGWSYDKANPVVTLYSIPVGGGVVRKLACTRSFIGFQSGTWSTDPSVLTVRSELTYNLWVSMALRKQDGSGHAIGSPWLKGK